MMALSTKLTLLVLSLLSLPIGIVTILGVVAYFVYGTLIIELSSVLSFIVVFLLVWERLRDSLSKKLEYLNDNVFLDLFSGLQKHLLQPQDEIRRARPDLKYARFMTIALFPRTLLKELDEFLFLHETFYEKLQVLIAIGNKKLEKQVSPWYLLHYLDFEIRGQASSPEEETAYSDLARSIKKDHHSLVDETKTLFERTKTKEKQIFKEMEEFLKCNSLRLKPEPVKMVSPYG